MVEQAGEKELALLITKLCTVREYAPVKATLAKQDDRRMMNKPPAGKECWGEYGDRFGPDDRDPEECFTCPVAEHCFRVTVADAAVSTAADLSFIVQNLMARDELKPLDQLTKQNGSTE